MSVKMLCSGFKRTLNLVEIHQNKNLFLRCSMIETSWAKPRKSFHISHFQSNCEIFGNRSRLIELNFSKHQIDLTRKNSWWWSPKFKIKQDNLFLNKNATINFWTSLSIGSNIYITYTYTYIRICIHIKDICKKEIFSCIILWLHLHAHTAANPYITSTYICICICMKDTCITRSFHLHHHMAAFMSAYPIRIFALDILWTNIYICTYICICIRIKDICITRFSFAPSQGCDHVCISNKDFASSIARVYHFEDLTHVLALGYSLLSFWGFNLVSILGYLFLSFRGFNLCLGIRLSFFILLRF